jgi:hypothetical protein
MRYARECISSTVIGGLFIVAPVYLAVLLLLKAMESVGTLVEPLAALLPAGIPVHILHWDWPSPPARRSGPPS